MTDVINASNAELQTRLYPIGPAIALVPTILAAMILTVLTNTGLIGEKAAGIAFASILIVTAAGFCVRLSGGVSLFAAGAAIVALAAGWASSAHELPLVGPFLGWVEAPRFDPATAFWIAATAIPITLTAFIQAWRRSVLVTPTSLSFTREDGVEVTVPTTGREFDIELDPWPLALLTLGGTLVVRHHAAPTRSFAGIPGLRFNGKLRAILAGKPPGS